MNRSGHYFGVALLAALALTACGTTVQGGDHSGAYEGQRFTGDQVRRSGAANAWQALQQLSSHLNLREDRAGRPARVTRRGQESVLLSENPIVVIDGAVSEFRLLEQLPVRDVHEIRVLTGSQATTRFGMRAANGAIVVVTVGRTASPGGM
jgi:hypothetical protein